MEHLRIYGNMLYRGPRVRHDRLRLVVLGSKGSGTITTTTSATTNTSTTTSTATTTSTTTTTRLVAPAPGGSTCG